MKVPKPRASYRTKLEVSTKLANDFVREATVALRNNQNELASELAHTAQVHATLATSLSLDEQLRLSKRMMRFSVGAPKLKKSKSKKQKKRH